MAPVQSASQLVGTVGGRDEDLEENEHAAKDLEGVDGGNEVPEEAGGDTLKLQLAP